MLNTNIAARAAPNNSYNRGKKNYAELEKELPRSTPREQLILFAIGDRKLYGLEIQDRIAKKTGGKQKVSVGSLYPIIQSLEDKGLIQSEWGDENTCGARRRYHRCT